MPTPEESSALYPIYSVFPLKTRTLWTFSRMHCGPPAGVVATHRRWPIAPRTAVATIALAVTPDLGHMLPMLGWSIAGAASMALHGTRHGS